MTNNEKYQKAIDECFDIEVQRGDIKVSFEYIGEGYCGDYTGEEDDVPFMRFYTWQKEYVDDPDTGIDHPDWNWKEVEDGSYCTQVPVDTPKETLEKMAWAILDRMEEAIKECDSVKKTGEECSWVDESWIKTITRPDIYKGRLAPDVAKELGMEIDNFLDEMFDSGYYYCSHCGEIVDVEQVGTSLNEPCDKCKKGKE